MNALFAVMIITLWVIIALEVLFILGYVLWGLGNGMVGATRFEVQWGRFGIRILRPREWFLPFRSRGPNFPGRWIFPRTIVFYWDRRHHEE